MNIHILIPVWGAKYILAFINIAMPTLLAPGNIPALARECNITVVFLTTKDALNIIPQQPGYEELARYCCIEYEFIDDLIAGYNVYAIPLTLAFVRGVSRVGPAMTETYFIFYNADFIIADGGLAAVLTQIRQGKDIILATSFRVNAEDVEPRLVEMPHDDNGSLILPPRQMVAMALKHMHHTVRSRIANQDFYNCYHWNQVYWQVDKQTLLARYFLATLFCVHPTVFRRDITSFIDYSFCQDFCPGGSIVAMTDSDDFFIMELQNASQELSYLKPGKPNLNYTARSLSGWTTSLHRKISHFETIIHSGQLPEKTVTERQEFQHFMNGVYKRLSHSPVESAAHFHWIGAVRQWVKRKVIYDKTCEFNELAFTGLRMSVVRLPPRCYQYAQGKMADLAMAFLGTPPRTLPWHPLWVNYRLLLQHIRQATKQDGEILYISDGFDYDPLFEDKKAVHKIFICDVLNGHLQELFPNKNFSTCIIIVDYFHSSLIKKTIDAVGPYLHGKRDVIAYFGRNMVPLRNKCSHHFMDNYLQGIQDLAVYQADIVCINNIGGVRLLSEILQAAADVQSRPFWNSLKLIASALACLINNLYCVHFSPRRGMTGVTGILALLSLKQDAGDRGDK